MIDGSRAFLQSALTLSRVARSFSARVLEADDCGGIFVLTTSEIRVEIKKENVWERVYRMLSVRGVGTHCSGCLVMDSVLKWCGFVEKFWFDRCVLLGFDVHFDSF